MFCKIWLSNKFFFSSHSNHSIDSAIFSNKLIVKLFFCWMLQKIHCKLLRQWNCCWLGLIYTPLCNSELNFHSKIRRAAYYSDNSVELAIDWLYKVLGTCLKAGRIPYGKCWHKDNSRFQIGHFWLQFKNFYNKNWKSLTVSMHLTC